jgi:Ca2+-binding RTX toxin-like protein
VSYYEDSSFPRYALSISCCLGGDDSLFGAGDIDYLVGGSNRDLIEGEEGHDLVFGDHAFITFDETLSHKLLYATTTNHSCSGGEDTIVLGDGDVSGIGNGVQ